MKFNILVLDAGVLSTTVYCALKECLEVIPVLLPCSVILKYCPDEYTGYGLDVPQNLPRTGEVLVKHKIHFSFMYAQ